MTGPSRRTSAAWARPAPDVTPQVDVLVPSCDRPAELAVTLSGLAAQDDPPFRVIVSDQSHGAASFEQPAVQAMVRVLEAQGRPVELLRHLPRQGLAEHRQFLLDRASAPLVLFLDDDVWLEPGTLARMVEAIESLGCGFVGSAVQGLSYLHDSRPHEREPLSLWEGPVTPETITRGGSGFGRWTLHNAANIAHAASELSLSPDEWRAYRVAWIGGCVLYRRSALLDCGGFDFWRELPVEHVGEDVAAQWRVMAKYGGAGILPSGAVHLEAPTTLPQREVEASEIVAVP